MYTVNGLIDSVWGAVCGEPELGQPIVQIFRHVFAYLGHHYFENVCRSSFLHPDIVC